MKLVRNPSKRERTELLLSHGKRVPKYIGDLGFEIGFALIPEEKKDLALFLKKEANREIDPERDYKQFFNSKLLEEMVEFEEFQALDEYQPAAYEYIENLTSGLQVAKKESIFDQLSEWEKDRVYTWSARKVIDFSKKYGLSVLYGQGIEDTDAVESQVGTLTKIKEILGSEINDYLIAIKSDWIFGYPELVDPRYDYFVDKPEQMKILADFKFKLGKRLASRLIGELDQRGIKVDMAVLETDLCDITGPYKPEWIMEKFVYPYLAEEVNCFRKMGIRYVVKHTDGNVLPILQRLIECGIDAFQAIDPTSVDIKQVKEVVRDKNTGLPKIALIGGIDTSGIVYSDQEFENHVIHCLKEGGVNGGYIPGATNNVSPVGKTEAARERYDRFCQIKKRCKYAIKNGEAQIELT